MSQLRRYIRLLIEAAVTGQQAAKGGLALFRRQSGDFIQYILYKPEALSMHLEDPSSSASGIVMGYIQVRTRSGDCNNASQVKASWSAPGGYGPLMYDLAMACSPPESCLIVAIPRLRRRTCGITTIVTGKM